MQVTIPYFFRSSREDSQNNIESLKLNGIVGEKDIAPHIRIIFVNGIMNSSEHCMQSAKKLSEIFQAKIRYTYNPTQGLLSDLFENVKAMMRSSQSHVARSLALNIQEALKEVEENNSCIAKEGGLVCSDESCAKLKSRVVVIAHSGGGLIFDLASKILHPHERKKLEVYTLGSAKIIASDQFAKVENYQSKSDIIPSLCQVLQGNFFQSPGEVRKIGDFSIKPLSGHALFSVDYENTLQSIRKNLNEVIAHEKKKHDEHHKEHSIKDSSLADSTIKSLMRKLRKRARTLM